MIAEICWKSSGVDRRVVFQKGRFGGCSPGTKPGTRVHSHIPSERKPERGHVCMFPQNPLTKPPFCLPAEFQKEIIFRNFILPKEPRKLQLWCKLIQKTPESSTLGHEIITKIIPWELFFVMFDGFCALQISRKERFFSWNYAWHS